MPIGAPDHRVFPEGFVAESRMKISDTQGMEGGVQGFYQSGATALQAVKIGKKLSSFGEDAPREKQARERGAWKAGSEARQRAKSPQVTPGADR
jgi:hypothetical protein